MNHQAVRFQELLALCLRRRRWIVGAVLLSTLAAAVWAVFRTRQWEAQQALVLRDEVTLQQEKPGHFRDLEQMKVSQETVLQLVLSPEVLTGALKRVGPEKPTPAAWPTLKHVRRLRQQVELVPPKGAEFGKTEILFLRVRQSSPQRAARLARAIALELQQALHRLRQQRMQSVVAELRTSAELARRQLQHHLDQLAQMEKRVGGDLAELRLLDQAGGDSSLRQRLNQLKNELRQVTQQRRELAALHQLLRQVKADPQRLLATPNRLLESQPALRRLKEGLLDAQLQSARLQGALTPEHPRVQAARQAEREIRLHLHRELDAALAGLEVERQLAESKQKMLQEQIAQVKNRLAEVARLRAPYAALVAQVNHHMELVRQADQKLALAQAALQTDSRSSLITLVGQARAEDHPVGPRTLLVLLGGVLGGLLLGLGVVVLLGEPQPAAAPPETLTQEWISTPAAYSPQLEGDLSLQQSGV